MSEGKLEYTNYHIIIRRVYFIFKEVLDMDIDIERDVYKDFLNWKNNSDLVLLVEGVRQIGKTYIVTKFANENFKNVIYINIADNTGKVFIDILNKYISIGDEKKLLLNTLTEYSKTFTNTKDTVVIIDEIQESSLVYNKIRSFNRLMYCKFMVIEVI